MSLGCRSGAIHPTLRLLPVRFHVGLRTCGPTALEMAAANYSPATPQRASATPVLPVLREPLPLGVFLVRGCTATGATFMCGTRGRFRASYSSPSAARSEAHDSGLCAADAVTKRRFATDLLNLTLAGPRVNRYQKVDNDAAEWLPPQNRCWYAARIIAVRQQYGLTIDRREADALDRVLSGCSSTEMIRFARSAVPAPAASAAANSEEIAEWDDNGNGRISCAEARAHGITPVTRDHPAYPFMRDGEGDGVVCESGSSRSSPSTPAARPAPTQTACGPYRNCTALRRDHPNGVRRGHCAYQRRMDRDNDGWAYER